MKVVGVQIPPPAPRPGCAAARSTAVPQPNAQANTVTHMQVTETTTEGLKREFRVVVAASDLSTRVNDRLTQMKDQVRINGFRPGKVPVAHLKKVYGRAVTAETIEQMMRETNAKIVTDHGLKLATDPKITMTEDKAEIESVIEGKTDLAYTVALEVVPKITLADFKSLKL
jgi:trigger factor